MLTLVTGPPGSGKTWYTVRQTLLALQAGKYVATNVRLEDGWALTFARANHVDRFLDLFAKGEPRITAKAREYERRVYVSGDLAELFALRMPACKKCKGCKRGKACQREGQGVMILDEAHEWLNARMWDIDHSGEKLSREDAVQNRLRVVKFFALHRKLRWDVLLITQSEKRLDNQVRDNFEFHTKLKNMKKFKVWGWLPVIPFNWFWAITFWHASGGERVGLSSYLLTKLCECYDTMARPEAPSNATELDVIALPLSDDDRAARARGEWAPPWKRDGEVVERSQEGAAREAAGEAGPPARPSRRPPLPPPLPRGEFGRRPRP